MIGTQVKDDKICPLPPGVKDERLLKPPFFDRPVRYIVHRHAQRAHLVYQTSLAEAERLGRRLYVVTACDHVKGMPSDSLSDELRAKLLSRSNYTQTEYLPGFLLLYRGVRLLLFSKTCPTLSLMKGCEIVLDHIYFSKMEDRSIHAKTPNPIPLSDLMLHKHNQI